MSKFGQGNTKASRLTAENVYAIRERYANRGTVPVTQAQLAREYQVSLTTIRNILDGVSWQSVPRVQAPDDLDHEIGNSQRLLAKLLEGEPGLVMTEREAEADPLEELMARRAAEHPLTLPDKAQSPPGATGMGSDPENEENSDGTDSTPTPK